MHKQCGSCGRSFDRGPGFLLGSIYFNYGATALIVVCAYFGLYFATELTGAQLLWGLTAFSLLFPLWFFRYARSLWIAFDELWDPWNCVEGRSSGVRPESEKTFETPNDMGES